MSSSPSRRAFTVIELLVVIAIIGILVGTVGVAMRGGDRTVALQASQSSLSSLIAAARAQAAIRLNDATIVIWGEYDDSIPADAAAARRKQETNNTYLHRAAIMTHEDTDGDGSRDAYVQRGDVIDLPRGIYFVPPDLGGTFPAQYENASDWSQSDYHRTQAEGDAVDTSMKISRWDPEANSGDGGYEAPSDFEGYRTIRFNSQGQLVGDNRTLVIAIGEEDAKGVRFIDSNSQRGLFLSDYGIPTIINEKEGLKK